MIFDDWGWSLAKSPPLRPSVRPETARDYDPRQIETSHVQLVCRSIMDPDPRYVFVALEGQSAIYRRRRAAD